MALYLSRILGAFLNDFREWKYISRLRSRYPGSIISNNAHLSGDIALAKGVSIGHNVILRGNISIGRGSFINGPAHFASENDTSIAIGAFCSIADYTYAVTGNHPLDFPSTYATGSGSYKDIFQGKGYSKSINIGNDVWIGAHSVILPGITIGNGAVIGAGSVVTKDVLPYAVVAGVPAKVLKMRFKQEQIDMLQSLKWWEWPDEKIRKEQAFFSTPFFTL